MQPVSQAKQQLNPPQQTAEQLVQQGDHFMNQPNGIHQARAKYEAAAEQGNPDAMFKLGCMFTSDNDSIPGQQPLAAGKMKQNPSLAFEWYEKAVNKAQHADSALAIAYLLTMARRGTEGYFNPKEVEHFCQIADANGNATTKELTKSLLDNITRREARSGMLDEPFSAPDARTF